MLRDDTFHNLLARATVEGIEQADYSSLAYALPEQGDYGRTRFFNEHSSQFRFAGFSVYFLREHSDSWKGFRFEWGRLKLYNGPETLVIRFEPRFLKRFYRREILTYIRKPLLKQRIFRIFGRPFRFNFVD
jgi:hypothetical protein